MSTVESNPEAQQPSKYPIAVLYQRSVLDPMVEVARAISDDFVKRPRHYRAVPENVAGILDGFRIRTGSNPEWPSLRQRADIFAPLFGEAFRTTSTDLRSAAVAFTERSVAMRPDPLEDRVRDTAVAFREYLKANEGRAVSLADSVTGPVFRCAVEVFQNEAVGGVFGLAPAPGENWPLDGPLRADATDGAFLFEEIQRALGVFDIPPIMMQGLTHHLFILFQRVAYYGAMTIAGVLEDAAGGNGPDWVQNLVRNAYGWEKALQSALSYLEEKDKKLQPRVVSQFTLDDEQLKSLPTEEEARRFGAQMPRGGQQTCTYGWTIVCDNPGPGQSCTYGWTYICDTGPTCTYGWTFKCDKSVGDF